MGQLGFTEMLVIFVVALLVFGPKKLPELGKSLGKGIREFKRATDELKSSWEDQVKDIKSPLDDVKRDIHNMGRDMKDDFYKSIDSEQPQPVAHTEQPALESHEAQAALEVHATTHEVHPTPQPAPPAEAAAPKEHV